MALCWILGDIWFEFKDFGNPSITSFVTHASRYFLLSILSISISIVQYASKEDTWIRGRMWNYFFYWLLGLDPCSPNPCGISGVCQDNNGVTNIHGNIFTCDCNRGWTGTLCTERKSMSLPLNGYCNRTVCCDMVWFYFLDPETFAI